MGLKEVLDILCCPACRGPMQYDAEESLLICPACRLGYPIDSEIVNIMPNQARELTSHERRSSR